MSVYKIVDGHDNTGTVVELTYQPRCDGIFYPEFRYPANNAKVPQGAAYMDWLYEDAITTAKRTSVMTECGLSATVFSNEVTIYALKDDGTWGYFNATAQLNPGKRIYGNAWEGFFIRMAALEEITP